MREDVRSSEEAVLFAGKTAGDSYPLDGFDRHWGTVSVHVGALRGLYTVDGTCGTELRVSRRWVERPSNEVSELH